MPIAKTELEIKLLGALKRIAAYDSPDKLQKHALRDWGCDPDEAIVMAYENIQEDAKNAMQAVAQRKPGRSKLVYDKTKRAIVAVVEGAQTPMAHISISHFTDDVARRFEDWHDDDGPVLWWVFPIDEPPYVGTPLDTNWPRYHTHWTIIPVPRAPAS